MKNYLSKITLTFSLFFLFTGMISAQDEDVMFQAFDWNVQNQPAGQTWYNVVSSVRNEIKNAGIDVIWMPPPATSAAPQGYLPKELYDFNTAYGTESQLRTIISQYHSLDIKVLSDIVINHRVGSNDAVTFQNPSWPTTFITADDEGRQFVNFPVEFSINGDYFPGRDLKSDGSNGTYGPARDLDHQNPAVRSEIIKWMRFLKNDIGFDGWRYDFVHGYNPIYNKEYNDATNPYFAVGELLESSRVQINNFVDKTQQSSSAFDFNTKVSLQNAIRDNNFSYLRDFEGRPSGFMGWNPSKAVTFLDNHDTGLAQQCCGSGYVFPSDETSLRKGYAYILTHPGNPMVFWTHFFDGGNNVKQAIIELIAIRKKAKVFSGSQINIAEARSDLYAAYIDGRNGTIAMKLGQGNWAPSGSNWNLESSGTDYAVWTNVGTTPDPNPNPNPNPSTTFKVYAKDFTAVYTWNDNQQATSGAWPGASTTTEGAWQTVQVPADCTNLIFSFNGNNQTPDLQACKDKPYFYEGAWFATDPTATTSSDDLTVYVQGFDHIYTWTGTTATSGDWPGTPLEDIGNGWKKHTIIGADCSNIIFSNNGNNQTADLNTCSDQPFYYNNRWNANAPASKSVTNLGITKNTIAVAPNPITANSAIYITTNSSTEAFVTISNILGQQQVLYKGVLDTGKHEIALGTITLPSHSELYFVTAILNGDIKTFKVMR